MSRDSTNTVLLCFDALAFEYLNRFDLPNFSSLRTNGAEAPLRSTFPPWTGSAWPSMYTGQEPGHHGVYDFFRFDDCYPDEAGLISRNDVQAPAIWNYLSSKGIPSIVLNVPVTHPAEAIEGMLIPGYLAPEDANGYPSGIRDELDFEGSEYRIYSRWEHVDNQAGKLDDYVELVNLRRRAAVKLLETFDWEFAMIQVQKTDTVFHHFDDLSAFNRIYEAADELVGEVVETVDENTNVIVCSDHGIGRTTGYRIYLNEILRRHGYLESSPNRSDVPTLNQKKNQLTSGGAAGGNNGQSNAHGLTIRTIRSVASLLDRLGISVDDVYSAARYTGLASSLTRHFSNDIKSALERGVDWRSSMAYCRSGNELGIRINLSGREPEGVVSADEYETVRDDLIGLLSSLETPDGSPAFDFVKRREEVYGGPFAANACDILFEPADMNHTIATNLLGAEWVSIDDYNHKTEGVFIGVGPGINEVSIGSLSLTDVAPLVMTLLGQPVPERMTGSLPGELVARTPTRAEYGNIPFGTGSEGEPNDGSVERRLENLGYL